MRAGAVLRAAGFAFDEAYTSVLLRAVRTLHLTLDQMGLMHIPEVCARARAVVVVGGKGGGRGPRVAANLHRL